MRARRWAEEGVEYVQLREKQMAAGEMVRLAEWMVGVFAEHGGKTKLLVNGRADVAVAAGADGVHLTSVAGATGICWRWQGRAGCERVVPYA